LYRCLIVINYRTNYKSQQCIFYFTVCTSVNKKGNIVLLVTITPLPS
jgi:hypothetical protein